MEIEPRKIITSTIMSQSAQMSESQKQLNFDEVMLKVTETVSSEEYLSHYGIHRPLPLGKVAWTKLIDSINKQGNAKKSTSPKEGIYPRSYSNDSVHYYAIRKEGSIAHLGNGYPNKGGAKFGLALDAQPDHSHGLCQTFALMYYLREDSVLKPGKYQENIIIGLRWLMDFTINHPWLLLYSDLKKQLGKWPASKIMTDEGIKYLSLHDVISWLLAPAQRQYLKEWAHDLGPDI